MDRSVGRKIRNLRRKRGLKTRDSSVGFHDLIKEFSLSFAHLFKYRMNYTSIGRQILRVQELPEGAMGTPQYLGEKCPVITLEEVKNRRFDIIDRK